MELQGILEYWNWERPVWSLTLSAPLSWATTLYEMSFLDGRLH